jgi:Flp pilus assembly protein TadD
VACSNAGRHAEAIAYADRALLISPRDPDMLHMAGLARLNAGQDLDTARRLLARASGRSGQPPVPRRSGAR